ncbi:MAG: ORF6N domain-containing protein [Acidobacteria bacterium]|nr:ORF6N domain-containing protein [Acidobacteriota bacterium]MCW5949622.1 ORF6N domain-containing protein [Pyrinomonadaceae bacterium]
MSEQSKDLAVIDEIGDKIYVIRGLRVMLDSDLAEIYQVATKVLNQAVKRNLHRFPKDFMFQLADAEVENLRSQFVTSSANHGGRRYAPYVFTEHGAVMLASVLNSPTAVEASIVVVRAFVKMRAMLELHQDLADRVEELEKVTDYHGQKFGAVSALLGEIMSDPKYLKRKIGFVEAKKKKK